MCNFQLHKYMDLKHENAKLQLYVGGLSISFPLGGTFFKILPPSSKGFFMFDGRGIIPKMCNSSTLCSLNY